MPFRVEARRTLLLTVALLAARFAAAQPSPGFYQSPGTKKMAALLQKIYNGNDWKADPNKPAERAEYYRAILKNNALKPEDEALVRRTLASELLRAGDSEGAVNALLELRKVIADKGINLPPEADRQITSLLAVSYLRLGEQENCAHMHGQRSCIFPIRGSGVHSLPRGAEGAVREYSALLQKDPRDALARWLLNVAYMQLGRYPHDVPAKWLVPEKLFKSDAAFPEFPEVAMFAGIDVTGRSGGAIMEDFDGDGFLDLMVSSSGPLDQMRFFHNNGDGTFTDRTREAGLTGEIGGLNLVSTDYNNDGHPDVLVLRGGWWGKYGEYPMSLLKNNGDGTFDDVTEAAGLMSLHPTQTAAWADYDNDGWLDLFVGHETERGAASRDAHPSQLFHNNRDGTFTEVGAANGLASLGYVKGVAWGDFNNDGRPDLYVSVKGDRNHLFRNDGPTDSKHPDPAKWKFTDIAKQAGVDQQRDSFATWFFDFDNDGWPDIFSAGYYVDSMEDVGAFELGLPYRGETPRLYRNNRDGTFIDVSKAMHLDRAILVMGANFGDLDNDGWLDIYLGDGEPAYEALLPNRMFRNRDGKDFQDVTTDGGFGHLQKGHGVAFGDLENSGSEDIFEEMGGAFPGDTYQSVLYQNPLRGNGWVTLELEGVQTNRAAFGARICVTARGAEGKRRIYRTVGYGSSFGGNPRQQHIGLGKNATIEEIEVRWPTSGKVERFQNVRADRRYRLREGDGKLVPVERKAFTIGAAKAKMPMSMPK
jgi:hypothetical protein